MQPKTHLCYAQDTPSFVSATFYVESDKDIFGWFVHASTDSFSAGFFMLENFYTQNATVLYRSVDDDLYGRWIIDYPASVNEIRSPLPDVIGHELDRIQSQLLNEWLFFASDPDAAPELAAYHHHGLAIHAVNIQCRKLNRLDRGQSTWTHTTPGMDLNVVDFLRKYWRIGTKTILELAY